MRYYIDIDKPNNKAEAVIEKYEAEEIPQLASFDEIPEGKALICVIDNGKFEEVIYSCGISEFENLTSTKNFKSKRWLLMDIHIAELLVGRI